MVIDRRLMIADRCVNAMNGCYMDGQDDSGITYDNHGSNEQSIYEEVAWLGETTRLPLDSAAILV